MNSAYIATVRLLLDIAPVVFAAPHFAIKGGTALNLFLHDLPRLSVDIDVVFTNHSLGREAALQAIASELSAITQSLEAMGYEVQQRRNSGSNETRLMVAGPSATVKVEVNEVFRGALLPLQQRPLSPTTEEQFAQAVTLPLLATAELYGSKLVAAMDRQHPRDLFDVLVLYNDTGLTPEIMDCFVAYLAGHNRPVHELLVPRLQPLEATFANQFNGMTRNEVSLEALEQTRTRLVHDLPRALTDQHRTFLLSLVQNQPRWDCMPFAHLQELPAIRWKLQNLAKLKGPKRAEQVERLQDCFQQAGGLA
ncbi:nucleotidyl transferase AbiEii/AbiGii toxin family protein [Cyanobium sp. HWJ4-Hawea]|uniref:nucleotidyl transferase AbiEii/AbiGii toxin family protein n=1 Tax=Cyanobium sp. HWJ4-Hawea TaxID=2823713 RepID=UPI0020CCC734|nr:nucleotidyl transferase AbiEii/AbiGii toxin family protein [Cyanobium sp. HWJ4-Hawea]MCP9808356.1 nucleotidyl transferase AbiEii/AbiGii toxin family protein [Cyanobium sp. HWJ4-Hawea]